MVERENIANIAIGMVTAFGNDKNVARRKVMRLGFLCLAGSDFCGLSSEGAVVIVVDVAFAMQSLQCSLFELRIAVLSYCVLIRRVIKNRQEESEISVFLYYLRWHPVGVVRWRKSL